MAERAETGGLVTLLQVLGARGGLVSDAGNQVDLFEAEEAPLPLPARGKSGPKGGRPLNVPNKSTEAWAAYLLSQHRSPLTVLANIMSQPLDELHGMLQDLADKRTRMKETKWGDEEVRVLVDPLAVLKLQKDAAVALAPYVHKQQPKALEVNERPRGVLLLGDLDVAEAEMVDVEGGLDLPLPPIVEKQRVSEAKAPTSDAQASDEAGNDSENNQLADDGS